MSQPPSGQQPPWERPQWQQPRADGPAADQPIADAPAYGNESSGTPEFGSPPYAPPQYGQPPYDPSQYGQFQYGQQPYGAPQYGQPPYGAPQYGVPQYGQPPYGAPQYGQFPYGQVAYPYAPPPSNRGKVLIWSIVGGLALLGAIAAIVVAVSPGTPDSTVPAPAATREATGLGDDPELDRLAQECHDGDMSACDDLFNRSDLDSAYEEYGDTCAGRRSSGEWSYCVDVYSDSADTSSD
jgi:hypothetical protein